MLLAYCFKLFLSALGAHLAIVKVTGNGEVVNILIQDRCHLRLLDGADTALGMQDEHGYILLAPETVYSRRPSLHILALQPKWI